MQGGCEAIRRVVIGNIAAHCDGCGSEHFVVQRELLFARCSICGSGYQYSALITQIGAHLQAQSHRLMEDCVRLRTELRELRLSLVDERALLAERISLSRASRSAPSGR